LGPAGTPRHQGGLIGNQDGRAEIELSMPHVVYIAASIMCPWHGCDFRIELVDFQLEKMGNAGLYARVMTDWGRLADFGLVARCPGCRRYVVFGLLAKQPAADPLSTGLPILPDDWHLNAYLA
jgi:hypothetical protein